VREDELVQLLRVPEQRFDAIRALVGGLTSTELRRASPSEAAVQALIDGLGDPNPRVRWWCVQLLDHIPDERVLGALVPVLDDPVPRVRRNAAHALGCVLCKPAWSGELPSSVIERLTDMAANDDNAKVRDEAGRALLCRT